MPRVSRASASRSTAAPTTSASPTAASRQAACSPAPRAPKTPEEEAVYGGAAGSWFDPCYHQLCDNLITVLTGVPPLDAEGLAPDGDDAAKHAAQRKMAGGAIKSLSELSGAASYAVYYFAASKDPFGTKPHKHD